MPKNIGKLSKHAQTLIEITPLLKVCLLQRLSEIDSLKFFEKHGIKISAPTLYKYKREYRDTVGDRFTDLMRNDWAEEHLLVLDCIKELERWYWEHHRECDNPMDAVRVLDSLRSLQGEKLMIYNDTPFLTRMREIFEARIKELPEPRKELKKSET